jgi:hypothetical protein
VPRRKLIDLLYLTRRARILEAENYKYIFFEEGHISDN